LTERLQTFDPWQSDRMTDNLNYLVQWAILIKQRSLPKEDFDIDFTTLLLAFLISKDTISVWFREYVDLASIDLDKILESKNLNRKILFEEIQNQQVSTKPFKQKPRLTVSANNIFTEATKIMYETSPNGAKLLDVYHLMGAYIYAGIINYHIKQLEGWLFDREKNWPNSFLSELWHNNMLTSEEMEAWKRIHRSQTKNEPHIEERSSPHIASDIWTIKDVLGYKIHAYAIARFLTHSETKPPICVSIQAPWGGGKTSLMRMVRNELDQYAAGRDNLLNEKSEYDTIVSFKKLKNHLNKKKTGEQPRIPDFDSYGYHVKPRVTIWFNAWKYESTEQVWAGLADSIVRGVTERMNPVEREWFFLQLNLRRQDIDNIRNWIFDRSIAYLWRQIRSWIKASVIGIVVFTTTVIYGLLTGNPIANNTGLLGILGSLGLGISQTWHKKSVQDENPAEISLGKNVKVPNYSEKLGFIHHTVEDLKRVFEVIPSGPNGYLPMVIFVDDLDRCSPDKVAKVIEGINLFLAGEFKDCIFVLGMDAEMVAAALEVAHAEVISKLPRYSTHTPLGWRFMDKFVQLPIIIPPSLPSEMANYTNSLVIENGHKSANVREEKEDGSIDSRDRKRSVIQSIFNRILQNLVRKEITKDEHRDSKKEQNSISQRTKLDHYDDSVKPVIKQTGSMIDRFSDKDEEVRRQISEAAMLFSNNPREIKRFINVLRYLRFLREGILATNRQKPPELEQLTRWIYLLLKWPGLVRWLYWSPDEIGKPGQQQSNTTSERLKLLENLDRGCKADKKYWHEELKLILQLKNDKEADKVHWITDENLRSFFKDEGDIKDELKRLSAAAGRGVY
jgi:KAP family P-loop domain